jgi:hypothetical protein
LTDHFQPSGKTRTITTVHLAIRSMQPTTAVDANCGEANWERARGVLSENSVLARRALIGFGNARPRQRRQ